jgi:hypothetical protein
MMTPERSHSRSATVRLLMCVSLLGLIDTDALAQGQRQWTDPPAAMPASPPEPATRADPPMTTPPDATQPDPRTVPLPSAPPASSSLRNEPPAQPPAAALPENPSYTRRSKAAVGDEGRVPTTRRRPGHLEQETLEAGPLPEGRSRVRAAEASPSFNCRYASSSVEHAICADPILASKDRRMAFLYEQSGGSRHGPVDQQQWRWLAARNSCARMTRGDLRACINQLYDVRIGELTGAR